MSVTKAAGSATIAESTTANAEPAKTESSAGRPTLVDRPVLRADGKACISAGIVARDRQAAASTASGFTGIKAASVVHLSPVTSTIASVP